eukprot:GSMAST32.ASY1.ANO1.1707.1 assembled CDS
MRRTLLRHGYIPKNVIGSGRFGVVWAASHPFFQHNVACKRVVCDTAEQARRALREIRLLEHFCHPNILGILDIIIHENSDSSRPEKFSCQSGHLSSMYIVTDLMETDLDRVIQSTTVLSELHIIFITYQLLCALKHIHLASVTHRLKLCDFGMSRDITEQHRSAGDLTEYVVTRWYRAPELLLNCRNYTNSIDMWATGCIIGEMIARTALFPGKSYIHQLQTIFNMIGYPCESDLDAITNRAAIKFLLENKTTVTETQQVQNSKSPTLTSTLLELIKNLLAFNPQNRMSANECLQHSSMEDMHDKNSDVETLVPGKINIFHCTQNTQNSLKDSDKYTKFRFDDGVNDLTLTMWKKLLIAEAKQIKFCMQEESIVVNQSSSNELCTNLVQDIVDSNFPLPCSELSEDSTNKCNDERTISSNIETLNILKDEIKNDDLVAEIGIHQKGSGYSDNFSCVSTIKNIQNIKNVKNVKTVKNKIKRRAKSGHIKRSAQRHLYNRPKSARGLSMKLSDTLRVSSRTFMRCNPVLYRHSQNSRRNNHEKNKGLHRKPNLDKSAHHPENVNNRKPFVSLREKQEREFSLGLGLVGFRLTPKQKNKHTSSKEITSSVSKSTKNYIFAAAPAAILTTGKKSSRKLQRKNHNYTSKYRNLNQKESKKSLRQSDTHARISIKEKSKQMKGIECADSTNSFTKHDSKCSNNDAEQYTEKLNPYNTKYYAKNWSQKYAATVIPKYRRKEFSKKYTSSKVFSNAYNTKTTCENTTNKHNSILNTVDVNCKLRTSVDDIYASDSDEFEESTQSMSELESSFEPSKKSDDKSNVKYSSKKMGIIENSSKNCPPVVFGAGDKLADILAAAERAGRLAAIERGIYFKK